MAMKNDTSTPEFPNDGKSTIRARVVGGLRSLARWLRRDIFSSIVVATISLASAVSPVGAYNAKLHDGTVKSSSSYPPHHSMILPDKFSPLYRNQLEAHRIPSALSNIGHNTIEFEPTRKFVESQVRDIAPNFDIDEIMSDVMARLLASRNLFAEISTDDATKLLRNIIRKSKISYWRKVNSRNKYLEAYGAEIVTLSKGNHESLDERLEKETLADELFAEPPANLTKTEREVYLLSNKGLSNQKIAETLGSKVGTVKKHKVNYNRKLREIGSAVTA